MNTSVMKMLRQVRYAFFAAMMFCLLPVPRAGATWPDNFWFLAADSGLSANYGAGTSCTDPDVVADTSVNSQDVTDLFAEAASNGPAMIVVCPGTYYISQTLVITTDMTVVSSGTSGSDFSPYVVFDGKSQNQIMRVLDPGSLAISGLVFQHGRANSPSYSSNCVSGSSCGGALGIMTTGTVTVSYSLFQDNSSTDLGGAIAVNGGEGLVDTGAGPELATCFTDLSVCQDSDVSIQTSTFLRNTSLRGGAVAMYSHNSYLQSDSVIENNTFYDNSNSTGGNGSAITSIASNPSISNNTIVEPTIETGGLISGFADLRGNILAVEQDGPYASGTVCAGPFNDLGGNVSSDTSCGWTGVFDFFSTTPGTSFVLPQFENFGMLKLSSLNGGGSVTPMFALSQNSYVNGMGPQNSQCPLGDQRGVNRALDTDYANCEPGSYERVYNNTPVPQSHTGGYSLGGSGTADNPFLLPLGTGLAFSISPSLVMMTDPSLSEDTQLTLPYTPWSVGDRQIVVYTEESNTIREPYVFDFEFTYPFSSGWSTCPNTPHFCIDSATIHYDDQDFSLVHTNPDSMNVAVSFLDGGNGVTSFNWAVTQGGGAISADHVDDLVTIVLKTGGFVPKMTTALGRDIRVDVSESGGVNTITITAKPTEINWLAGGDPDYSSCSAGLGCGDDTTQSGAAQYVLSGNVQDLHTWGSSTDAFAGFYSAQNAQFGPTMSVLALQLVNGADRYWELTLANPHLSSTGAPNTGTMNAWMPPAYFESLGTTAAAAAAVGFTIQSEETTGTGIETTVIPASLEVINGGLMVSVTGLSYSTNKIRVYNNADPGITVRSATYTGLALRSTSSIDYTFHFDRRVSGVADTDFEFASGTTAIGCVIDADETVSNDVAVHVSGCGTSGDVILKLKANSVQYASSTGPSTAYSASTITIDNLRPSITRFSTTVRGRTNWPMITYDLQFSEAISGLSSSLFRNAGSATGCQFAPSGSSGAGFYVQVTNCSSTGTLRPRLNISGLTDRMGLVPSSGVYTVGALLTLDRVSPTLKVTSYTPSSTKLRVIPLTFVALNRGEQLRCSTITASDFRLQNGRFISSTGTGGKCKVKIASTFSRTGSGFTSLAKSPSFSVSDVAGNTSSTVSMGTYNWFIQPA